MKYAMCPQCGRRLCRGVAGTKVEIECPKCSKVITVIINSDDLYISEKPLMINRIIKKINIKLNKKFNNLNKMFR